MKATLRRFFALLAVASTLVGAALSAPALQGGAIRGGAIRGGAIRGGAIRGDNTGPQAAPIDQFHPDREIEVEPAYGGRVIVHLSSMPASLNRVLENSAVTNNMMYEVHERLVMQDWEFWDIKPRLCRSWDTEDQIVLKPGAAAKYDSAVQIGSGNRERWVLYGEVTEGEAGLTVSAKSKGNGSGEATTVASDDVEAVQRGTVFTFYLKPDVKWHDGHVFDASDVYFTWNLFNNEFVSCDASRFQFTKVLHGEVVDPLTVRFFYAKQHFKALETVGDLTILPQHLYDLNDPDNEQYDPQTHKAFEAEHGADYVFTPEDLGEYVNDNPHNDMWVGLGPYRVTAKTSQYIEAERFEDYNPAICERVGYFDTIRWRYIGNDDTAKEALLNGELDYWDRVKSEDYFGEATSNEQFTGTFYKGYNYYGAYGYTGWNTKRPQLKDPMVRKALAHAFDVQEWLDTKYKGLAIQVTGPQNYFGPAYDHSVKPLSYDPDLAEELLAEAGWYDRDGDGIIDKDGVPFEITFMMPTGNDASKSFGLKYMEALGRLGIKLNMQTREWATFLDKIYERDFDCINLAWVPPLESDPQQLWHSSEDKPKTSNHAGVNDPEVDRLIDAIQIELDAEKRTALMYKLHRKIYDLQPYFFMLNSPRKFAVNKKIRGYQGFKIAPSYSIRRWYYPAGTEGTRATLKK